MYIKLALTSLTRGGRSVGIVRSRTQAMEFSFLLLLNNSAGIATGYGLDEGVVGVRVPVGSRIFTSSYRVDPF
jgi:hypothetical protein